MRSQFWDLDFTQGASHDLGPGIFLAHDFQDMDGEPGDFIVSEGHGHLLVLGNIIILLNEVLPFIFYGMCARGYVLAHIKLSQ